MRETMKINMLFVAIVLLLFAGVFLVNGIAVRLDERFHLQADLTYGAVFEVGEDTRALLAALDSPVEIFVLSDTGGFGGSPYLAQAQRIIDQYSRFSSFVTLEYVDYAANPLFAVRFPELALSHGDLVVQSGGRVEHLRAQNLFYFTQLPDGNVSVVASRAEEALTSAILSVVSEERVRVALLTGNGTTDGGVFPQMLLNNNYAVQTVSMTTAVFSDFDVLLLLSPTIDLSEDIVRRLEAFLYNNGRYGKMLIYTAGAAQGALPNLDTFLAEWGIRFDDGMVFETDPERTYHFQPFYPIVRYVDERYALLLRDPSMPFLAPLARPMELIFTARDGYHLQTLLEFSETAGVRPADAPEDFTASDATRRGPLPALAVSSFHALAPDGEHLQSHILVSASTGIFDTIALQNTSVSNAEYLLNLLGDLTGREDLISIRPVSLAGRTLGITSAQAMRLGVILTGVLPLLIFAAGASVWLYRRYK
ncbi:MAG: GldG family protein [Oscillospiraceae bacterium]|nr:GldG family protein [Oscillospiraceae bacterium]